MGEGFELRDVLIAFSLTLFAGLSTTIGSGIAYFAKRANTSLLSIALGFSAGVMIYVSLVEIFLKARDALVTELGEKQGSWATVGAFFLGIGLIMVIDKLVPSFENPHEVRRMPKEGEEASAQDLQGLYRVGLFSAMALAIHNFPEGFATFAAGLKDPMLGIPIAVAIAIHNIPEGVAVSVPIYYATGNRNKAFLYSFLSGCAEPVGAGLGFLVLWPFMTDFVFGVVFASVAGIMVFISLDELLPAAREYGEHHLSIYGLVAGMGVMAVSLLMFL